MRLLISSFDATIRVKRAFHPAPASWGFASHVFLVLIYSLVTPITPLLRPHFHGLKVAILAGFLVFLALVYKIEIKCYWWLTLQQSELQSIVGQIVWVCNLLRLLIESSAASIVTSKPLTSISCMMWRSIQMFTRWAWTAKSKGFIRCQITAKTAARSYQPRKSKDTPELCDK